MNPKQRRGGDRPLGTDSGGCVSSSRTASARGSVGAPPDGSPDRQISPDAELTRSFAIGCAVLFLAFLLLTAFVYYFWSRS